MANEVETVLTIEGQKKISLTGTESVDAFSENEIRLTVAGKKMRISGSRLKILAFSKGSGAFSAIGEVNSVRFGRQSGKFFQRLFK